MDLTSIAYLKKNAESGNSSSSSGGNLEPLIFDFEEIEDEENPKQKKPHIKDLTAEAAYNAYNSKRDIYIRIPEGTFPITLCKVYDINAYKYEEKYEEEEYIQYFCSFIFRYSSYNVMGICPTYYVSVVWDNDGNENNQTIIIDYGPYQSKLTAGNGITISNDNTISTAIGIPSSIDGTYILKATVSNGNIAYSWIAE